jgi:hypothetical protein
MQNDNEQRQQDFFHDIDLERFKNQQAAGRNRELLY